MHAAPTGAFGRHHGGPGGPAFESLLTEDQLAELKAELDALREAGASHEEVRAAVDAKLSDWGIELPEQPERPTDFGHHPGRRGPRGRH